MRVIIEAVFLLAAVGIVIAVIAVVFVAEHIFAVTVLGAAVAAVVPALRHQRRRRAVPGLPASARRSHR